MTRWPFKSGAVTHPARRISCHWDQWRSRRGRSRWWRNPAWKEVVWNVTTCQSIAPPDRSAPPPPPDAHRAAHEVPPCGRQEVAAGGRKHSHQLLQRLELPTTTIRSYLHLFTCHFYLTSQQLSLRSHRFGVLLKVRKHPFEVFEVGGERSVVEREVPLPGGAALQIRVGQTNMSANIYPHRGIDLWI